MGYIQYNAFKSMLTITIFIRNYSENNDKILQIDMINIEDGAILLLENMDNCSQPISTNGDEYSRVSVV